MLKKILGRGHNDQKSEQSAAEPQAETKLFDREQTSTITVQTSRGAVEVLIKTFSALTGWEVKSYAKEFYSADRAKFLKITNAALAHASVGGAALDNEAAVNELLERWQNVEAVFEAVMAHNGIDMSAAFALSNEMTLLGVQIGKAVVGAHDRILEPLRKMIEEGEKE